MTLIADYTQTNTSMPGGQMSFYSTIVESVKEVRLCPSLGSYIHTIRKELIMLVIIDVNPPAPPPPHQPLFLTSTPLPPPHTDTPTRVHNWHISSHHILCLLDSFSRKYYLKRTGQEIGNNAGLIIDSLPPLLPPRVSFKNYTYFPAKYQLVSAWHYFNRGRSWVGNCAYISNITSF